MHFATQDIDTISKYVDILESKIFDSKMVTQPQNKIVTKSWIHRHAEEVFNKERASLTKAFKNSGIKKSEKYNFNYSYKKEGITLIFYIYVGKKKLVNYQVLKKGRVEKLINEHNNYLKLLKNAGGKGQTSDLDNIKGNQIKRSIVNRLRNDIANFSTSKLSVTKINWKLLPTSEISFQQLKNYLDKISNLTEEPFDYEKIDKIIKLKPDNIYCGFDEFEGYLVFYFEKNKLAVLDCPKRGNAIYIFGEDWKILSRLTKLELLNHYSDKTKRIIHRGDWFERLKNYLTRSHT